MPCRLLGRQSEQPVQWKRAIRDATAGGLLGNARNDTNGRFEHEHEHEYRFAEYEYEYEYDGGRLVLRTQDRWSVLCRCCCSHSDPVPAASSSLSLSTGPRYARTIALTGAGVFNPSYSIGLGP